MKKYTINGRIPVNIGDTFPVGKDFFKLDRIENDTAVIRRSGTNDTFTYGVEMLRRTLRTIGYELEAEQCKGCRQGRK